MGEVIIGNFITSEDIPCERVLDAAKAQNLDTIFVLVMKDGETYFAASTSDVGQALVLFERFKREVL